MTSNLILVEGTIPTVERFKTGLWSLDHALGQNGMWGAPLRSIYEIYGHPHVGKSSLSYYLAGRVQPTGKIVIADIEGTMDGAYLTSCVGQSGFHGTIKIVDYADKKGPRHHEAMMQEAADALYDDETVNASVVDSLGMIQPIMEREGDLEEAFVGRRALIVAKWARRASAWLRSASRGKATFVVNHVNPIIGGRGHVTPGGQALKYAASVRLMMYRAETLDETDGTFLAECKIEKLRYGGVAKERKGLVVIIPGIGISPLLTSMFDCITLGLAKREASIKAMVRGEWTSVGRIGSLLEAARNGDTGRFDVFREMLDMKDMTPGAENG